MMELARGRGRTLAIAAAVLFAGAPAFAQARPAARQILDRYVEATGGAAAHRRVTSRRAVGEMQMSGMSFTTETLQARPNLMVVKVDMPGMGQSLQGYNGTVAWSSNPMQGPRVLTGDEARQMAVQADFDASLYSAASFTTTETVGEEVIDGKACWKVRMVHVLGHESTLCFDKQTGLLLGSTSVTNSDMGSVESTTRVLEYGEFDGIRMPVRMALRIMGQEMTMTLKSVEHGTVETSAFGLPAEIRALVEQD